jgi:hypothetical protein
MNISEIVAKGFELQEPDYISREALQAALSARIAWMLQYQTEELFSRLYRLDIFESKIKEVLAQETDVPYKIAGLIIDRQIEKEIAKKQNPTSQPEDEDLKW